MVVENKINKAVYKVVKERANTLSNTDLKICQNNATNS